MEKRILDTVFVSGYTQAPKGTKLFELGATLGVFFEIDRKTHLIVDAECTFVTSLAKNYFKRLLIDFNFKDDLFEMIETIEENLFIPSTKSIIVAVRIAHQRYIDSIASHQ